MPFETLKTTLSDEKVFKSKVDEAISVIGTEEEEKEDQE